VRVSLDPIEARIATRLAALRQDQGLSLDALAERTGLSRATLSRIERAETSPTAAMLGRLCSAFGITLSRLMVEAEAAPALLVRAADQPLWTDPGSGFRRRAVSPPGPGLKGEVIEGMLPAGAAIDYAAPPVAGLEHHLWLLDGALTLTVAGVAHALSPGDCLRYRLHGPTRFECPGPAARYLLAMVHP
jgi:transcriptional regulator with XRE-family HTH domain